IPRTRSCQPGCPPWLSLLLPRLLGRSRIRLFSGVLRGFAGRHVEHHVAQWDATRRAAGDLHLDVAFGDVRALGIAEACRYVLDRRRIAFELEEAADGRLVEHRL